MAVQAQYPSNAVLLNRGEQEFKGMDYSQASQAFLDQSGGIFFPTGAATNGNARKRGREPETAPPQQGHHAIRRLSLQPASMPSPTFISLAQLQNQTPPLVSTGLRLAFEDQNQNRNQNQNQKPNQSNPLLSTSSSPSLLSTVLSDELAAQLNQQRDEIDQFLAAQIERLRRVPAESWQRHYPALLGAAEEVAARKLREKEAEMERAASRGAELEDRLTRLRAESMAWQAKAMADQAAAAALNAQLQQAQAAAALHRPNRDDACADTPAAEDAESAHIDPGRVEPERACRACWGRPATVVLLPCRHLCLCSACDGDACPVCRCPRTGSVQVFLP